MEFLSQKKYVVFFEDFGEKKKLLILFLNMG